MFYAYNLIPGVPGRIVNPDPATRGYVYFMGYILAANVSGAFFNPAISLGAFIAEWNPKHAVPLILTIVT